MNEAPTKSSGALRFWSTVVVLGAVYFVVGKLGLLLAFARPSVTPVWPPSGIAIAALLLLGYRVWPGILLGALAVELTTPAPSATALAVAVANVLESLAGAWLANRFARGRRCFERPQDVVKFAVLVGMIAPLLSPPLGVRILAPDRFVFWPVADQSRLVWWLGDMCSIVVLTPLLLVWAARPRFRWNPRRAVEYGLLLGMLVLVSGAVFGEWSPQWSQGYLYPYLCLPFLFWAAFRFGEREAMTATLALGAVVMWGTLRGQGLFSRVAPDRDVLVYQAFMATTSVMILALAAVVGQRRRGNEELREAHDELERRVEQRTEALRLEAAERRRKEEELRQLNRTLQALSHSDQALLHASDEAAYLQEVCGIVVKDCGHQMVWVGLAESDEGKTVRAAAHAGFEEGYLETLRVTWADTERGRGPTGSAIRTGQVCLCRDTRLDPRFQPWREEAVRRGYTSSISLPLLARKKAFGALTIYSREPDPFTEDEVRLLTELAGNLAYGISSLRLRAAHAQAEDALRRQEQYYRTLAENLPGLVYRTSHGENPGMQFFNDMLQPMTGYTPGELSFGEVCSLDPLIVAEDRPAVTAAVKDAIERRQPFAVEYRLRAKGGDLHYFAERGRPLYGKDGRPSHIDGVIFDITERKRAEAALKESQSRLRQLAENIHEVFWLGAPDWNEIFYISPAYEEVWGRPCSNLYQSPRSWLEAVLPEDRSIASNAVEAGVSGGATKSFPAYRIRRPDGTVRWIRARAWPIQDEAGRIYRVAGIAEDITEQKHAEEERERLLQELAVEKARWQATVESMPDPVTVCDAAGRATFMNTACASLLGRTLQPGTALRQHSVEYQLYHIDGTLFDPRELPLQKAALTGKAVRDIELIQRSRAGTEHICVWNAAPLRDAAGRVTGAVAVGRDITAQRRAEQALRLINEELEQRVVQRTLELRAAYRYTRSLLEASLDPLVTISQHGKITDVNKATEEITGMPRERLIGSSFSAYFTEPARAEAGYQRVLAEGLVRDYPLTIRHATGRAAEVLYNATVYRNEMGRVQGVFAAARDITERRRLEDAHAELLRRLADAQETERGRISRELHDRLGQDLTALKLGLQFFRKQGPFPSLIQDNIGKLEHLADGLVRDIHRLAWELRPAVLDDLGLEAALRRYIAEWSEASGVPVDFHSHGLEEQRLPFELETNLYRVTQEALTNVVRHARARRVSVLLERRLDHISLIIEDDGAGFEVEALVEGTPTQGKLGLLGMQERVSLVHGTLEIESSPGAGTTVFVRIPPGYPAGREWNQHEKAAHPSGRRP